MSKPLVSICCTAFNHEKFIAFALEGFLMQKTNFAYEILINDDCSTDNTANILKDYAKRFPDKLTLILQKENLYSKKGKPLTRVLFSQVKGKYVALCEGDDFWTDENKLQKQVDFLEKNTDYSFCFHKSQIVDENNFILETPTFSHLEEKDYTGEEILQKWSVPTASAMFRAEYIKQIANRAKTPGYYYGDTPMFLTLMENGKSRCLPDTMSAYRIHEGGISRSTSEKSIISLYHHYETLKKDFNGKYRKIMTKNISSYTFGASGFFLKKRKFIPGLKFLMISILYDTEPLTDFFSRKLFLPLKRQLKKPVKSL